MSGNPPQVAIVEDDADNRELLVMFLEQVGFEVACWASGEEALEALGDVPPGLIITDVTLSGGMSGVAFAAKLRERAAYAAVPIFAITGHAADSLGEGRALFAKVFTKPVDPMTLATAAKSLLRVG